MNELNKNLNFYKSYFHGFQDIIEHKSAKQTAVGVGKILLGFTFIVPIIFGLGLFITEHKLHSLENLCNRVSKHLNEVNNGDSEEPSQKDLTTFLSTMVLDKNQKKPTFEAAFKKLDSISQKMFFDSMSDQKVLADSLKHIPKDTREINIGLGRNPSKEMIDKAIIRLHASRQLHTITFDLSQTTYLTRGIEKNLIERGINIIDLHTIFKSVFIGDFDLKDDYVNFGGSSGPNNALPASRIIHGIVYHLIKESQLAKINLKFKQDGQFRSTLFINPSRLSKISEKDLNQDAKIHPLNHFRPLPDAKDIWLAYAGSNVYMPKE